MAFLFVLLPRVKNIAVFIFLQIISYCAFRRFFLLFIDFCNPKIPIFTSVYVRTKKHSTMKNLKLLFLSVVFLACYNAEAQTDQNQKYNPRFNADNNCMLRYFYYPNLEAYFDSKNNDFIFRDKGQWVRAAEIPSGYRGYSLNNGLNVTIDDYDDDDITQFIDIHKKKFPPTKGKRMSMAYQK